MLRPLRLAEMEARAKELYQKILTMDLGGPDRLLLRRGLQGDRPLRRSRRVQPGPDFGVRPQTRPDAAPGLHQEAPGQRFRQERVLRPRLLLRPDGVQGGRRRVLRGIHGQVPGRQVRHRRLRRAHHQGQGARSTRASPWPRSSRSSPAIRAIRTTSSTWPSSTRSRTIRPRPKRNTARTSPRATSSNAVFALTGYANFWIEQGKNLESAEEMADIVAAALGRREGHSVLLPVPGRRDLRQARQGRQGPGRLRPGDSQEELGRSGCPGELCRVLEPPGEEPRERRRGGPAVRRSDLRLLQQLHPRAGPVQAEEISRGPQGRGEGRRAGQAHGRQVRGLPDPAVREPGQADQGRDGPEIASHSGNRAARTDRPFFRYRVLRLWPI